MIRGIYDDMEENAKYGLENVWKILWAFCQDVKYRWGKDEYIEYRTREEWNGIAWLKVGV